MKITLFKKYVIHIYKKQSVSDRVKKLHDKRRALGVCVICGKNTDLHTRKGKIVRYRKCEKCRKRESYLKTLNRKNNLNK